MHVLSTEPVMSAAPPGCHAKSCTSSEWPRITAAVRQVVGSPCRLVLVPGFHTNTSPASPPEASMSPPGLKRTTLAALVCDVRVSTCFTSGLPSASSLTSHSLISLSVPHEARSPEAGLKSTESTGPFSCQSTWTVLHFIVRRA
eukprot:CAMPEP_0181355792 /NCGR_PEP_ID=MMETSP1106-20121128/4087_1 /TAXON_ID=81844 /ORGANISM="Mantoniella antarctica, Strain SL-175" /LENGTH=143 /DNA_ID=CAMNT_0023468553 /DNA_START=198 /DNA_END=626 /DNA_ORIENTATION=+